MHGRRRGGASLQKAGAARPDTPCWRALGRPARTRPSTGNIRLVDKPGAGRCCGCGVCAVGAAAPRRCTTSALGCVRRPLGRRPRALPLAFPRFPQPALHDIVPLVPLGSSASRAFPGCRELGGVLGEAGRALGHTPWVQSLSACLGRRWPSLQGALPSQPNPGALLEASGPG